jgi:ABC-2 type transport system permease protein
MGAERPGAVLTGMLARRAVRSGVLWALVFGALTVSSIVQFTTVYPTPESRREIAVSAGGNAAIRTLFGTGRALETIPGWVAWRSLGIVVIIGSIWGLLAGTRRLRGEEDAGRWDRLVAGPTTRRRATRSAVLALGGGLLALWAVTAAVIVAADAAIGEVAFGLRATLFLAVALVAPAAVALATGGLVSQLVPTRRRATALGAGVLAAAYLLRMAGSGPPGLRFLLWATPFGWVQHLHPLTGSPVGPLVPLTLLVVGLAVATVLLAGVRDVGAGLRSADDSGPPRTALLIGNLGLAVRLERPVLVGWAGGVAAMGFLFGSIAATVAATPSAGLSRAITRLGAHDVGVAAYLGTFFLLIGATLALVAAGQVAEARREEADARLDTLLVQPVGRLAWLGARLGVAAAALIGLAAVAGVAGWGGAVTQGADVGLGSVMGAALNAALPALVVVGLGALALGAVPRQAVGIVYGAVGWSFAVKVLLVAGPGSQLLLDLSLFHHVALMPAAPFRPGSALILLGVAVAAAGGGAAAFGRRDLSGA